MEEAPAAAVEEGLPDDTRDAATSPMPSTSMPPLVQESSSESDDDDEMPPLEDGEIRYVSNATRRTTASSSMSDTRSVD